MASFLFLVVFFVAVNIFIGKINEVRPADWRGWFYDLLPYVCGVFIAVLPAGISTFLFVIFLWVFGGAFVDQVLLKLDLPIINDGPLGRFYSFPTYFCGVLAGMIIMGH